ncbi:hypothetical protein AOQ84DRAFT_229570 [Glonium stellatum]|uniref:Uncharacterized protein n=1 Tax=Glonium stellatum TaxID=574774 RepID=A0A8E2EPA3_9PEZI|nr:hypothetical protein AOQ84DRAFT_229570 [Glonium stellatum]
MTSLSSLLCPSPPPYPKRGAVQLTGQQGREGVMMRRAGSVELTLWFLVLVLIVTVTVTVMGIIATGAAGAGAGLLPACLPSLPACLFCLPLTDSDSTHAVCAQSLCRPSRQCWMGGDRERERERHGEGGKAASVSVAQRPRAYSRTSVRTVALFKLLSVLRRLLLLPAATAAATVITAATAATAASPQGLSRRYAAGRWDVVQRSAGPIWL